MYNYQRLMNLIDYKINKTNNMNINLISLGLAVLSTIFYAMMDAGIKWTTIFENVDTSIFFLHVNFIIFIIIALFAFLTMKEEIFNLKIKWYLLLYRGTLSFINFYLAYHILHTLPLDIYYSIAFTTPAIASVLSVFILKERLNSTKIVALTLGLIGILIIINPFEEHFSTSYLYAIFLTIILNISVSLSMISTKQFFSNYNSIKLGFYVFLSVTVYGIIANLIMKQSIYPLITVNYNIFLAFLVAIFCLLGFGFFIQAYKRGATQILAPTEYLLIIWGIIYGVYLFKDPIYVSTIIGACIVIISNLLIVLDVRKRKPSRKFKN